MPGRFLFGLREEKVAIREICNNPAATQVDSCGLSHWCSAVTLFGSFTLGHFPVLFSPFELLIVPLIHLAFFLGGSSE